MQQRGLDIWEVFLCEKAMARPCVQCAIFSVIGGLDNTLHSLLLIHKENSTRERKKLMKVVTLQSRDWACGCQEWEQDFSLYNFTLWILNSWNLLQNQKFKKENEIRWEKEKAEELAGREAKF